MEIIKLLGALTGIGFVAIVIIIAIVFGIRYLYHNNEVFRDIIYVIWRAFWLLFVCVLFGFFIDVIFFNSYILNNFIT